MPLPSKALPKNGLSIPTQNDDRGIAAVSITSDNNKQHFELLNAEKYQDLRIASQIFHNHVISKHYATRFFCEPMLSSLNKTETILLQHTLEGLLIPEVAKLIHKSDGYLKNVMIDIRRKIGGSDNDQRPLINKESLIHHCGLLGISKLL